MHALLRVRWAIQPALPPQPVLPCSQCRTRQPFRSSGLIRLNANGRKLDAWLIYRCTACDSTWNRPVFERRSVRDIAPSELVAMQDSDATSVAAIAFDLPGLRKHARDIVHPPDIVIIREVIERPAAAPARMVIALEPLHPTAQRLDRVLATGLGVSRNRVETWHSEGRLRSVPELRQALRRPLIQRTEVSLGTSADEEWQRITAAACRGPDAGSLA